MAKKLLTSVALVVLTFATILLLPSPDIYAHPTVLSYHYAFNQFSGNFTGLRATYTVPSTDPYMPGTSVACINHPLWITYPNGGWVEMGISKCPADPAGKYHLYGFAKPGSGLDGQWGPFSDQVDLGSMVNLELRKINSTTWGFYVNGVQRWSNPPSHPNFANLTDSVKMGLEVHSPAYRPRTTRQSGIQYQTVIGGAWFNLGVWNPNREDETPERYYISQNNGHPYDVNTWGYGLPTVTGWAGPNYFQEGRKDVLKTNPWEVREAEEYSGIQGIDAIQMKTASNGETNRYIMGWHQADRGEFIMEIPENHFQLYLIGISDKPGPVLMNIYLDAQYIGQMSFPDNDNARHLWIKDFNLTSIKTPHPHAITVEFANDYYASPGDGDRNFYLDLLAVTECCY